MADFQICFTRIFAAIILSLSMQKLKPVEEAKALFEEAKDWGVWKWLTEKRRVRQTADAAWEALEAHEQKVKATWNGSVSKAAQAALKETEAEARQARMDAEAQFDEADRKMSISMAREGAQMAIDAWVLREKLLRKMEALGRKT